MTTQQKQSINKMLPNFSDFRTLIFAAIGAYIGLKTAITEIKKDMEYLKPQVSENKKTVETNKNKLAEMEGTVNILKYMHNLGTRGKNKEHNHNHKN